MGLTVLYSKAGISSVICQLLCSVEKSPQTGKGASKLQRGRRLIGEISLLGISHSIPGEWNACFVVQREAGGADGDDVGGIDQIRAVGPDEAASFEQLRHTLFKR